MNVEEKIKSIIVDKMGVIEKELIPETVLRDLGDSLDAVELIMEFEKEFDIAIPDAQAEKIITLDDAVKYIQANTKS